MIWTDFQDWLSNEYYNDRIELSPNEFLKLVGKVRELELQKGE